MDELRIDYSPKGFLRTYSLLFGGYSILLGLYLAIIEALAKNYSIVFFCSLALIILAIIIVLYFTLWRPKPLLILNNNNIETNIANQKALTVAWEEVTEINVGISTFVFMLNNKKPINIDLSTLVYDDLKIIKTRIIELCEIKEIPFHNI